MNFNLPYGLEELQLSTHYCCALSDYCCSRNSSRTPKWYILRCAWHWIFTYNSSISKLRIVW